MMGLISKTYEYLLPGGPVMIPLILISIWMWVLIIERMFYFRRMGRHDLSLGEAIEALKEQRTPLKTGGLRNRIVSSFLKGRTGMNRLDKSLIEQCAMRKRLMLKRNLSVIAILAAVAPLFGLLGTVTGMMTTFDAIGIFGTGNAKAVAGGISEALITTQSGLLVAIPGLFMSEMLNRRNKRLEGSLNELVLTLKRYV
jgi:biopolymer transport protein ExbB